MISLIPDDITVFWAGYDVLPSRKEEACKVCENIMRAFDANHKDLKATFVDNTRVTMGNWTGATGGVGTRLPGTTSG